ncbi:phage holin family protein [Streptomyces sp. 3MP-14]|uniref:Phage holin family protein n=1 Tax=Streptomyces mimosae TaxID=2586635 RepID=A0A5N6A8E7_9ACTN|nr:MULTISPECIES: phage holin family protein [Streptomyces]KAB8163738.1 phage holin family protein [Streptomyces mimosae]KAB8175181.1 phage holin family protein [Streptomyces sp. 3MP-14]
MSAADEGRSLGELVASATSELSGLVHDEIALAKAEIRQDVKRALFGSVAGVIAAGLVVFAVPLLSFALAFWLRNWWDLPLAVACVIVAGLYLVLALALALWAKRKLGKISPPERSIRSAKESATLLSHAKPRPRENAPNGSAQHERAVAGDHAGSSA